MKNRFYNLKLGSTSLVHKTFKKIKNLEFHSYSIFQSVVDGEQCGGMRSSNICLDGACTLFGCDNRFHSPLQVDDCGICGGNGSQCTEVTGHKELPATRDYQKLIVLEKGEHMLFSVIHLKYEGDDIYVILNLKTSPYTDSISVFYLTNGVFPLDEFRLICSTYVENLFPINCNH